MIALQFGRTFVNVGLTNRENERTQLAVLAAYIDLQACSPVLIASKLNAEGIKGRIGCAGECAIANYFVKLVKLMKRERISVSVAPDLILVQWDGINEIRIPLGEDSNVQKFIGEFDDAAFPELIEEES